MHEGASGVLYGLYSIEEWFLSAEESRLGQRVFANVIHVILVLADQEGRLVMYI